MKNKFYVFIGIVNDDLFMIQFYSRAFPILCDRKLI